MCSELARLSRIIRELNSARARTKEPLLKRSLDEALLLAIEAYINKRGEKHRKYPGELPTYLKDKITHQ